MDDEILLGIGYKEIRFGMSKEQVRSVLGKADHAERLDYLEDGSQLDDIWDYDDPELELTFAGDNDFRLTSIKTGNPSITVKGERIIGSSIEDVARTLQQPSKAKAKTGATHLLLTSELTGNAEPEEETGSEI